MPYSIPSSTKILTLVTLQFLFIVGILSVFEFAMVPGAGFPNPLPLLGEALRSVHFTVPP